MPTAQPYYSGVQGNGLPFIPETKIDVTVYDYWSTLGGYTYTSGGSVSAAQIRESLEVAAKLFWHAWGMAGYTDHQDTVNDLTVNDLYLTDVGEPYERAEVLYYSQFSSPASAWGEARINVTIVRLYEGDVTDEANFIGYGISVPWRFYNPKASVEIGSYLNQGTLTSYAEDIAEITLQGAAFICKSRASATATYTPTLDAANRYAYSENNVYPDRYGEAEIEDIEFYTF